MPKIIENLRESLLAEARRQIVERGYACTTVRSVASGCGVGVGTVYNYFPSKEMLIATFVFEDWKRYLEEMSALSRENQEQYLGGIFDALRRFAKKHEVLFSDAEAAKLISGGAAPRHRRLREQIASLILPLCEENGVEDPHFTAEFLAESILCWSMSNTEFERVYPLLAKNLK